RMTTTDDVLPTVIALVRETLFLPAESEVRAEQLLFADLGCSSMEFLDLLFRLEHHFGIAIPHKTLYELARGKLTDAEFATDGVLLTDRGREQLLALLADTPRDRFPPQIHAWMLYQYCTVGAVARLVTHLAARAS
ncbi:MAG TPA: acyl carrier protein, partial [Planctomycetaceae bacterium]|nr:acyl carrier protein [Planctomycetaceae bacterium]